MSETFFSRFGRPRKAQSFLEYAMLIIVISTAIIAMQTYIRRSVNAKLRQITQELDEGRR